MSRFNRFNYEYHPYNQMMSNRPAHHEYRRVIDMTERRKYLATETRNTIKAIDNNNGKIYKKFKVDRCDISDNYDSLKTIRTAYIEIVDGVKITYKTKDLIIKQLTKLYDKFNKKYGKQYKICFMIETSKGCSNIKRLDNTLEDVCKNTYTSDNLAKIEYIDVKIIRNEIEYRKRETAKELKKHIPINDINNIIQDYY